MVHLDGDVLADKPRFGSFRGTDLSLHSRAPILTVEAKLADMDAAGIDGARAGQRAARLNHELAALTAVRPGGLAAWASHGFGDTADHRRRRPLPGRPQPGRARRMRSKGKPENHLATEGAGRIHR